VVREALDLDVSVAASPVVHSILDAAAVRSVIERVYPFGERTTCALMQAGMNDTYLLAARGARSIARVYRAGWRSGAEILCELQLLAHLAERGVPVSEPIPASDGSLMIPLSAPEGERFLVLFTYVEGQAPTWTNYEHCRKAGALLARVHDAADDFVGLYDRAPLDVSYLIERPLEAIRPFLLGRPDDWSYLCGFADRLRARLAGITDHLEWGACHGDFSSTGNFCVGGNGDITVFDFDLCGPGWHTSDLAPMQRAAIGHRDRRIWRSFLRGYLDTRRLPSADLAAVPLFYAACRLWSIGMRARHTRRRGALYMDRWYVDWQLRVFRQWEAAHGRPNGSAAGSDTPRRSRHMNHDTSNPAGERLIPSTGTLRKLPVTYSILDADALAALVEKSYEIAKPLSCELLLPSMNDTYLVAGANERRILRVYRASWRSADDVTYELNLLMHLGARGVHVALPIAARDGRLWQPLAAPEGARYIALFTYAGGEPLAWENLDHCRAAGRLLADIHTSSGDYIGSNARAALDAAHLVDRPADMLQPYIAHREDDAAYLAGFAERLRSRLNAVAGELDWGVCHGDFGGGNVSINESGPTAFDFDLCGPGWPAFDLAAIRLLAVSKKMPGIWDAFIEGYQQRRWLTAADLAAATMFCPVHRLWRLGLQASHVQEWGVLRVSDSVLDRELTFFRTWEAEELAHE
jgi:Ser/Thr protein kinase RdoA (MazF antagonist)